MTILFRYVTREILLYFGIVLAAVLSIYLVVDFIEKVDDFIEAGVPVWRCVVHLLYKLPFIFAQIGPLGFLLSILVAFGLMRKNNEVIALKSGGVGKRRLLRPAMALGLFFSALMVLVTEWVVPVFMVNANQIWLQEVRKKNIYASRTNDIWMRAARQIIHISQYDPDPGRLAGISIFTFDDNFRLVERIDALSGRFSDRRWQLEDAVVQTFGEDRGGRQFEVRETIHADLDLNPDDLSQAAKRSDEMGMAELRRYIEKVEREGYPAVRYRVDFHGKIAASFVCLLLSLLGSGIALKGRMREGLPTSIVLGLGSAFLYWIFNSFSISLGYAEMLPPLVAAWAANFVFLGLGGFLLLNAD